MKKTIGWILFIASFVFFGIGLLIITIGTESAFWIGISVVSFILAEITFWLGGAMLGIGWIKRWKERRKSRFRTSRNGGCAMIEIIFRLMNTVVIVIWLMMLIRPYGKWTQVLLHSRWLWVGLGGVYASLLIGYSSKLDWIAMANPTYEGITKLFAIPEVAAIAWIHLLIFDLLAGRMIVQRGKEKRRFILPFLLITLMAGPLGFGLYFLYDYVLDYRRSGKYNIL